MLRCFTQRSPPSSSFATAENQAALPQGNSADGTPISSAQHSPTVILIREYKRAVQTNSYKEIQSKIQVVERWQSDDQNYQQQLLEDVLQPNPECIKETFQHTRPNTFTRLVNAYFDHSEHTCHLLLLLRYRIHQARSLYAPVHDLFDILPAHLSSLTQSQCDRAFDAFHEFDRTENPFHCTGSHNLGDLQSCLSQVKEQVDRRLHKSRSRVGFIRNVTTCSAVCMVSAAVGVAVTAVVIATHALAALVALSFPAILPCSLTKKELSYMGQLRTASKSAYFLDKYIDNVDGLANLVCTDVEGDKLFVRIGLARGKDRHLIYEMVKQLRRKHENVLNKLTDLEEHICHCFVAINSARSVLLEEIIQLRGARSS
ncbi:hypothetical protein Nepgr_021160 [Nepenthes gracilis]|uniref:Uncharacterized protein n=1 Tax=Nepenthes gracilis TaxID=150966 RepID=A0AAD3XWS7_NEPGR|nr:hypothetical protein Nepgr_021160 [Nepenthes gracilis]